MSKYFEIVIFTASAQDYADRIIDKLDPDNTLIHHRLYRQHLTYEDKTKYYKDLSKIGRDLNKILIIDNNKKNFKLQVENGIKITTWKGDPFDICLLDLINKLINIADSDIKDVRNQI